MDDAKRELVRAWLVRASHDLEAARILSAADPPLLDVAIYHCQQAAEKSLKSLLVYRDLPIERTHNLLLLLERICAVEPSLARWVEAAAFLTPFATAYRYPLGLDRPEREDFEEAIEFARGFLDLAMSLIPTSAHP